MKHIKLMWLVVAIIVIFSTLPIFSLETAQASYQYKWSRYNVVNTTTYTEGIWGSWSTPVKDYNTYVTSANYSFSSSSGFSLYGSKNPAISGSNPGSVYTGSSTSITETYVDSSYYNKTRSKTATTSTVKSQGSTYIDSVKSANRNQYPDNSYNSSDNYWYVYTGTTDVVQVVPTINASFSSSTTVLSPITITGTANMTCYRIAIGIKPPVGNEEWFEGYSVMSYSKTYTPTQAGTYQVTIAARSYAEGVPDTGVSQTTKSFSALVVTPSVSVTSIPQISLGSTVSVKGTASLPTYRMAASYAVNGGEEQWLGEQSTSDGKYEAGFTPTVQGTYTVRVYARSYPESDARSGQGVGATTFVVNNKPMTPTNLRVTYRTSQILTIEWDAVSNATSYEITRTGDSTTYTVTSPKQSFNSLTKGTNYTFSVTAVNSQGKSAPATYVATTDSGDALPDSITIQVNGQSYNATPIQ